jgi:hypothetical protein
MLKQQDQEIINKVSENPYQWAVGPLVALQSTASTKEFLIEGDPEASPGTWKRTSTDSFQKPDHVSPDGRGWYYVRKDVLQKGVMILGVNYGRSLNLITVIELQSNGCRRVRTFSEVVISAHHNHLRQLIGSKVRLQLSLASAERKGAPKVPYWRPVKTEEPKSLRPVNLVAAFYENDIPLPPRVAMPKVKQIPKKRTQFRRTLLNMWDLNLEIKRPVARPGVIRDDAFNYQGTIA